MSRVFRDCCRDAYLDKGYFGVVAEFTNSVFDLLSGAVKERVLILINDKHSILFLSTALLAIAGGATAAFANLRADETPNPLLLILIFSFVLGFIYPRRFWVSGSLIGLMMPAIHFLAFARGWQVDYPTDSSTPLWAFLTLIPALLFSFAGASLRLILKYIWSRLI